MNSNNYYPEPTTKLITLPNYPTTLPASDVYSWAKQPNKPSYSFGELSSHPTTLGGYGITDAVTIDTYQEIYGIKEFATTVYISTAYDTMLALKSLDDENFAIIDVRNKTGNSLSKFGYYGDRWAIDSNTILHTGNYAGELDNRYVNKAGDTMTGTLLMSNDSDIYGRSAANSGAAYIIGYRDKTISGIVMHDISQCNNAKALYIETNGYDSPSDTGGLAITNDCVTAFGAGDKGSVFRVLNEDNVNLGALFNVAKDGTLTMCFGGGNVGIGTTSPSYKLHVNGDTYCSSKITSENWIRSDLYSAGIDHYCDDSYSAAYNACAPNNDNYCCYSIVRSGTIPLGIGFNTSSEIWLGTANTDRKAAAQWLRISGNRVTCSSDIFAYGEVAAGSASDLRLKEIQKRPSYANRLLKMGLVRDYYFNDLAKSRDVRKADNDLHTGMIYQDVLPVLSSMCGVDDDGYGKLNYIKPDFICTIAGATQDNTIELIKVNTRMSKLETAIRHLKRKINKLERKLSYEQASIQ